jgi:hypothetical protein
VKKPVSKFAFQVHNLQRYTLISTTPGLSRRPLRSRRRRLITRRGRRSQAAAVMAAAAVTAAAVMAAAAVTAVTVGRCTLNQVDP